MNSGIFNNPFIGWGRYRKEELRQYGTKIVPQMRCQIFVNCTRNSEGILTYVEGFLCKMTENMQADVALSRKAVFVRCCLKGRAADLVPIPPHADGRLSRGKLLGKAATYHKRNEVMKNAVLYVHG